MWQGLKSIIAKVFPMTISIHPSVDKGVQQPQADGFSGGQLLCKCPSEKVIVTVTAQSAHNHVCGCSKCWKPKGATFSMVAVVPSDSVTVTSHEEKLETIDESALIKRHACKGCGVHMYGRLMTQPMHSMGSTSSILNCPVRPAGQPLNSLRLFLRLLKAAPHRIRWTLSETGFVNWGWNPMTACPRL